MTPLDKDCPHINKYGFGCSAKIGMPCVELHISSRCWVQLQSFHTERIEQEIDTAAWNAISVREWEVLTLYVNSHNYESIGNQLDITTFTVAQHLRHIQQKLKLTCNSEIVSKFYQTYYSPKIA